MVKNVPKFFQKWSKMGLKMLKFGTIFTISLDPRLPGLVLG